MIMIEMMVILMMTKITKTNTNVMTFQEKYTNFRDYYSVKKWPKHPSIGKTPPPPLSGIAQKKTIFFFDVFSNLSVSSLRLILSEETLSNFTPTVSHWLQASKVLDLEV